MWEAGGPARYSIKVFRCKQVQISNDIGDVKTIFLQYKLGSFVAFISLAIINSNDDFKIHLFFLDCRDLLLFLRYNGRKKTRKNAEKTII